jgi:hypothetical protein
MAKFSALKDDLDFSIKVIAEGQDIARRVSADVAGLRLTLASLYQLQDDHYRSEGQRRAADAAAAAARAKAAAAARAQAAAEREAAAAAAEHSQQMNDLAKSALALAAAFYAFQGFRLFITEGLKFNETIETANLGIASLITSQAQLTMANGRVVTGVEKLNVAQALATDQVNKLRIAGLLTTATTEDLVVAFQQAVGVGLRWGMSLDQIRKITIQMSQAAGALGLPMNQLNEEIRDFLGGNISARNTRIATALGVTNEQVREAQKAGKLFDFVTGRLQAFSTAGEATAKTFAGTMSNIREALQNFAGDATAPLFESLKTSGQKALEEVFDLKNARISASFAGLLSASQEIFAQIGDGLSGAIETGIESAKDLSAWFAENKNEVTGILEAVRLLNGELSTSLGDVIGLVAGVGDAGVKAGVFKTILVGVGAVVATIHEMFQLVILALGVIGNMVLTVIVTPFIGWLRILARAAHIFDEELGQSIDDAAQKGEDFMVAQFKGLIQYGDQLQRGGLALDQFKARVDAMEAASAKATETLKKTGDAASGVTLKSTAGGTKPTNPAKGAAGDIALAKQQLSEQLRDLKIALDNQAISYADYYDRVTKAHQDAIDKQIAAEKRVLAYTTDEGAKRKIIDAITALEGERTQVVQDQAEARRKAEEKLDEEVLKAQVSLLRDQGKLTEAHALEIQQKYQKLIATLKVNGRTAGAEIVTQLFDVDAAKVRMQELSRSSKIITDQLALDLSGIQVKVKANAITDQQAIDLTADAYRRAKDALSALIPDMEAAAAITKDPEQIAAVELLKQKIEDMGTTIARATDNFLKLKEGGRDALQTGLADFLDQAIEGAKSFHDIWLDVARGVVSSLRKIASQMIANLIIQRALSFFGGMFGGGAGDVGAGASIAGDAAGAVVAATGGYITGAGSATSDSIPAWLSNGEFVVKASAVDQVGVDFLHAINESGSPGFVRRSRSRGYADGGLVTNARGAEPGGFAATIGLEEGLVARHIETKAGTRAVLNVVAANRKSVRALLGPV